MNDQSIIQPTTKRVGINLGSYEFYSNGQMLKNLIGHRNPGFEPTITQQIWTVQTPGTTTTFAIPDIYDNTVANYWTGGTFTVVNSQSGGAELGCTGTIASDTGPNYPTFTGVEPTITVAQPCAAPFAVGDEVILSLNMPTTPESWWESGEAGVWPNVSNGGKLTSDNTDLCATCGSQALKLDATATGSTAQISQYFDSASAFDIFVLMNGTYQVSFWAKAAAGSPTLQVSEGRYSTGGYNCGGQKPNLTTTWAQYTFNCVVSETQKTTAAGTQYVTFEASGGAVYLDNISYQKINTDPTNTTVFRDEVINTLKNYYNVSSGGNGGTLRYWLNQNGETYDNWTQPDYASKPSGTGTGGQTLLPLEDYLNICKLLNAEPYLEVPVTISTQDAQNLVEFLQGPASSGPGARRAALGQVAPWTTEFSQIHLSFCNECWNSTSFPGQSLAWRSTAPASQFYYDYAARTTQVFAAMRSAPDYAEGPIDLVMDAFTSINFSMDTAIQQAHPDSVEIEGYSYNNVNTFATDQALWQPDFVEVYDRMNLAGEPSNFYTSLHDYQNLNACGASGAAKCVVNVYEWGANTLNGKIDQTHMDYIDAGAGQGIVAAMQGLMTLQTYGVTASNYFGLTEYQNGALNGLVAKTWGIAIDMGGATNNVRPQYLGLSLANQSIIGPMYACPLNNNATYAFAGSTNGISGVAANPSVPYLYSFCFENGSNRSMVLINTDLSSSHTVNFVGTNVPYGTVTQRQYAPSSPDLMNEAPTGSPNNLIVPTVANTTTTLTNPNSITLPPLSVTALDFTTGYSVSGGAAATPVFSLASGLYVTVQSVSISDSTPNVTIYYTTDGSTPTTSSAVYTGPLTVGATETVRAIAASSIFTASQVASATYTVVIPLPTAATPVISLPTGSYTGTQTVTISDSSSGATIYYTLDGSTPTTSSAVYSGAISVHTTETIQAIAAGKSYVNSAMASSVLTILSPVTQTPVFGLAGGVYYSAQTLTLSDATPGAVIYYTTNATTPTTSSTLYTGPISITGPEYVEAVAIAPGYLVSHVSAANYSLQAQPPVFSVPSGNYTSAQTVTITDASPQSYIVYTTNGATPTNTSTLYKGPITVSSSETIKAMAIAIGLSYSAPSTATYTIGSQTSTPAFSVAAGTYSSAQTVAITDATAGATIYYTTNGTTPTTSSVVYSGPITVNVSEKLEALAVGTGFSPSAVASAAYIISTQAATPAFSLAAGTYTSAQTVAITDSTAGATIYYTTNGAAPTTSSAVYSGPITVSATETIEAIAGGASFTSSAVASALYTISNQAATPIFSVAAGTYTSAQTVAITDATAGTTIYYTTNGTTPTTSSAVYSGPITVSATETLEAIAGGANFTASAVASSAYIITPPTAAPTFSVASGVYTTAQNVAISETTAGATVYYTTNGTTPTPSSTAYSGPIMVSTTETLEAIAVVPSTSSNSSIKTNTQPAYIASPVTMATYTIETPAATPTFSVAAGAYSTAQTVAIADATSGATIHYTTNGTTPTATSAVYSGPITVSATETLEAIAVASNYTSSAVASAAYTITSGARTAMPAFSVPGGTYYGTQTVTITDATAGAVIYYTVDTSTPTTASPVYSGPIAITTAKYLQAIAVAPGAPASSIAAANYNLRAQAPVFSLVAGNYSSTQTLTITDSTPNSYIVYTTDGSTPTSNSPTYKGPISITATMTVKAFAIHGGYNFSTTTSATFTISGQAGVQTLAPVFSLPGGDYASAEYVKITGPSKGSVIYYTTTGVTPTTASTLYTAPVQVAKTETLKAIAIAPGYKASQVESADYIIANKLFTPKISLAAGTYSSPQKLTLTDETPGVQIRYTTDGAAPTATSTLYTGSITVNATEHVQAVATKTGFTISNIASAYYAFTAATPQVSVKAGTYSTTQSVTVTTASPDATLYFTTNGTTPTTAAAKYKGPITVATSETLQVVAAEAGYTSSPIVSAAYVLIAETPQVSVKSGTYTSDQSVTLTSANAGAKIYYTTNGATPTTASTLYKTPITVSTSETIHAIAVLTGFKSSSVASETYVLEAAAPQLSLKAGTYTTSQTVTLTSATKGAKIYYTTNGASPTTASTLYKTPFEVKTSETVKAIAYVSGFKISTVVSEDYTLVAATPEFSVKAGTYASAQAVALKSSTAGEKLHSSLNGSAPTTESNFYTKPIEVKAPETLKVIAVASGFQSSAVAAAKYVVEPKVASVNGEAPNPSQAGE